LLNQVRAVDRVRLVKRLGSIDATALGRVDDALRVSLGLIPLE
jgi:mRNA-degrading endonuclease toxin of MazEF toxin-antitoxin module